MEGLFCKVLIEAIEFQISIGLRIQDSQKSFPGILNLESSPRLKFQSPIEISIGLRPPHPQSISGKPPSFKSSLGIRFLLTSVKDGIPTYISLPSLKVSCPNPPQ